MLEVYLHLIFSESNCAEPSAININHFDLVTQPQLAIQRFDKSDVNSNKFTSLFIIIQYENLNDVSVTVFIN